MRIFYFLITILFSNNLFAQVAIEQGEPAPETGIFLTKEEAAKVIAEKKAAEQICKINQEAAIQIEKNKCSYEKNLLKNELSYEKIKYKEINNLRDVQERRLFETLSDGGDNLYWFIGGLAAGATVTAAAAIGVVVLANQVNP